MEAKNTGYPNGNPHRNCFAQWVTPGIETSQYRSEQNSTEMSLVTASERDTAQTEGCEVSDLVADVVYWAGDQRLNRLVKSPGTERDTG